MSSLSSLIRSGAPAGFIEPCLPSTADKPPSGASWIHEIKHDGYRLMARRDPVGIRLLTRNGNDWSDRFPLVVEAVNHLKVRSCLIDGEVVCCDERGLAVFHVCASAGTKRAPSSTPSTCWSWTAPTCGGSRSRCARRRWPASCARAATGVRLNEHLEHPDGALVFAARLQDGRRGHRVEAARLALPLGPLAGLAEVQEPGGACGEAGGGRGLGKMREGSD